MTEKHPVKGPGYIAAGAYLQHLRLHLNLSPTEVAARAGTDASVLTRVEQGRTDTRGSLLLNIIDVVGGNPHDVKGLLQKPDATADDGIAAARAWIALQAEINRWLKEAPDLEGVIVPGRLSDIADDMRRLAKWLKHVLHQNGLNGSNTPESPTRQ